MAFSTTPRNSTTRLATGTATTLTLTFTVTSTIAGDVGVVAIAYDTTATGGSPNHTFSTVPAGWSLAQDTSVTFGLARAGVAIFINPSLPAGTTSLAWTVTGSGTGTVQVFWLGGAYGAFFGGTARSAAEGANGASSSSSSTTLPSVTTAVASTTADLIVWGGMENDFAVVNVGTPTGFTSVAAVAGTASSGAMRLAVAIGTRGSTTTASGATCASGVGVAVAVAGVTTRAGNGFFALAKR